MSSAAAKISPDILFIIVIFSVILLVSVLLRLLMRFLVRKQPPPPAAASAAAGGGGEALQRQLQQLFHLHDSGLDQASIDALPMFHYDAILGPARETYDCAVCLYEFAPGDRLRLLPACGHAFHVACIDTWLLSNSTCPLCRGSLALSPADCAAPLFDCSGEQLDPETHHDGAQSLMEKSTLVSVRLGKFRGPAEEGETHNGESSRSNLDARRCYSMGTYQYVLGDNNLHVRLSIGHDIQRGLDSGMEDGRKIARRESFSVSKIWLWSNKKKLPESSSSPWLRRIESP